jgi:hypothetical protein
MLIVPVRHHSPAAALQVGRLIRARRPRAVLVEGPVDATDLIPLLLEADTVPPVALYAYREPAASDGPAAGQVRAVYYPFCEYSPEYVALQVGQEVGARLLFCDVPTAAVLAADRQTRAPAPPAPPAPPGAPQPPAPETGGRLPPTALPGFGEYATRVAAAAGFETFEEFWEAVFEQDAGARPVEEYLALLGTFGAQARAFASPDDHLENTVRERHMAAAARALVAEGLPAESIVLVCGAAHAAAVAAAFAAPEAPEAPGAEEPAPAAGGQDGATRIALIPFSYPRLSEQLGYGAGNRAPWYYGEVWRRGGDYHAATRLGLLALARDLRAQGQSASLAQCIDGYSLATVLARMRQKPAPGVDELREAAVACFGQGHTAPVAATIRRLLIGEARGGITSRVGRTPLQEEFYATTQDLRLPLLDSPRTVLLHLVVPREAAASAFLHRLAMAEIPFARELQSGLGGTAPTGPLQQLARVRERWELQWTPATDARLIERTAWGSTLAEVCTRLLGEELAGAARIDAGTTVLLRATVCDLLEALPQAVERCEALAADSASFPALARATFHLDGLLAYGAARHLPAGRLGPLAGRLFARAVAHLPASVACGDEAAEEMAEGLRALDELVGRRSVAGDPGAYRRAVAAAAELPGCHPALRGLALVLLELGGHLPRQALAGRLRYWLSRADQASDNAKLIAGLFSLHRGALVRNRDLIGAVTDFLSSLELEQLAPLLPVLRRSLGRLSRAERAYLAETIGAVLGVGGGAAAQALRLTSTEAAVLHEADAAVGTVLRGWEERYGIA